MNTALRADLAEAAAIVLIGQDQLGGSYDFTGRPWTFDELAQVLSDISGRTIIYREVDEDEGILDDDRPRRRAALRTPDG